MIYLSILILIIFLLIAIYFMYIRKNVDESIEEALKRKWSDREEQ